MIRLFVAIPLPAELRRRLDRTVTLAERGLVSRQEVDTQGSQVEAARATVARTQAQVAAAQALIAERTATERQATVRAPISGRLGQRNAEVGMLVDPQTQLFVVGQLSRMRIEVPVSQDVLGHLEVGDRAKEMFRSSPICLVPHPSGVEALQPWLWARPSTISRSTCPTLIAPGT